MKLVDGLIEVDIERVQVMDIHPGDVILVTLANKDPSREELENVHRAVKRAFHGNDVLILTPDVSISVARPREEGE